LIAYFIGNISAKKYLNPFTYVRVIASQRGTFYWETVYIHFWGLLPLMEFCRVRNSLCVQVLHSPILAVLVHGTPATGVSETLRRGTRNGITKLLQTAPPILGWATITLGIGPHSSWFTQPQYALDRFSNNNIFCHNLLD